MKKLKKPFSRDYRLFLLVMFVASIMFGLEVLGIALPSFALNLASDAFFTSIVILLG